MMKVDCEGCEFEIIPLMKNRSYEMIACEIHRFRGYNNPFPEKVVDEVAKECARDGHGTES